MPSRASTFFAGAIACVAMLVATWYLAFHAGVFTHADESILRGFYDLHHRARVHQVASFVAGLCNPRPYIYFALIPVIVALARRRPKLAIALGAILLGANVTTQLLKPLLAQPRVPLLPGGQTPVANASWPSGHATAAMSLALCAVLAAPPRVRPLVAALGAGFAVAVSYSFLTLGWHYPSDVFGGYLVAGTWTMLAVAALRAADGRRREPGTRLSLADALGPPAGALAGAVALAAAVAIARPREVVAYARAHEVFTIGAGAIAAAALALATAIVLALRR